MEKDKFKAIWVSHSSIGDFIKCPRLYYLRNVYRDPKTGHKVTVMKPPLALGQIVHDVIEALSVLPSDERLSIPLSAKFETQWQKVTGKLGGFTSLVEENEYKERGLLMLKRVEDNPAPILEKAIKLKHDLPNFWLSEEENIILCGKIDWLKYRESDDTVHILDFKTGKNDESEDSLQLPIYMLLVKNIQKRDINGISYWYLDRDDKPVEQEMPNLSESKERVMEIARRIKLGRQINHFKCPKDGCFACRDLEKVVQGKAELVGVSNYNQDIYTVND